MPCSCLVFIDLIEIIAMAIKNSKSQATNFRFSFMINAAEQNIQVSTMDQMKGISALSIYEGIELVTSLNSIKDN